MPPTALYKAKHTQLPAHGSIRLKGARPPAPHLPPPAPRDVMAQLGAGRASLGACEVDVLVYVAPSPHLQARPHQEKLGMLR